MSITPQEFTDYDIEPLFKHAKREGWGLAILAWQGRDKRRYQFEDGKLRTFKQGYYHLLTEVDRPLEEAEQVVSELTRKLDLSRARRELVLEVEAKGKRKVFTLEDQVTIFQKLYKEGFHDIKWRAKVRGDNVDRRLKKHRDPAIADAQKLLSKESLQALIDKGDFAGVKDVVSEVLRKTNLTRPREDMTPLKDMPEERLPAFAATLMDLLYGEDAYPERFNRWVKVLTIDGQEPTWQMASAIPALVHPKDHVCVRPSSFREQARWMAPRLKYQAEPTGRIYVRYRNMARAVRKGIRRKGDLKPRDLMDIYEFVWVTLRPKARALLKEDDS